jgi:hypothetical protein
MRKSLTSTETLERIIGKANVETYLKLYALINEIQIDTRDDFQTIFVDVEREVKSSLTPLVEHDLLSKEDVESIWTYVLQKEAAHKKGVHLLEAVGGLALREFGRGNKPQDEKRIVDVLIYLLVYDSRMHSGKAHYSIIADFLSEQGICDGVIYKDVARRYERFGEEAVISTLHVYDLLLDTPSGVPFIPDGLAKEYDGFLNRVFYRT